MDNVQDIIKRANQIANDIKNGNSGAGSTIFITQDHPQYNELKKIIEKK